MRTYKELIEQIGAALPRSYTDGSPTDGPTTSDVGINTHDIERPEVIDRVNAALAHLNKLSTSNPKRRIEEIKVALSHAGVDFDHTAVGIGKSSQVPVKHWGGRIGFDEEGNWVNDDGFSHKGNSYALKFDWNKNEDHLWDLKAQLVPSILGEQMGSGGGGALALDTPLRDQPHLINKKRDIK